jgi:quercetin dioxygenase-like cupin family protein
MRGLRRAVVATVGTLTLAAQGLAAQDPVPVHREPRHRPVWEDGPVRVLDVRIPPGDTSLYHIHDAAILYVPIAIAPTDAQPLGGSWTGIGPQDTSRFGTGRVASDTHYAARPLTHRVTNVGAGLFRLIAIVNGGPGDPGPADSTLPGQVETGSSWFRQSRLALAAGATTPWYTSPAPLVVVQVGDGTADVERGPDAGKLEGAGATAYVPAGTRFRLRNGGAANTVILVQVR